MPAIYKELFIDQGADFSQVLRMRATRSLEPQNLIGFTARGLFRRTHTSGTSHILDVEITNPEDGELTCTMLAANTALLRTGRYFYNIELVNAGVIRRAYEGVVHISPAVVSDDTVLQSNVNVLRELKQGDFWPGLTLASIITDEGDLLDLAGSIVTMQIRTSGSNDLLLEASSDAEPPTIVLNTIAGTVTVPGQNLSLRLGRHSLVIEVKTADDKIREVVSAILPIVKQGVTRHY